MWRLFNGIYNMLKSLHWSLNTRSRLSTQYFILLVIWNANNVLVFHLITCNPCACTLVLCLCVCVNSSFRRPFSIWFNGHLGFIFSHWFRSHQSHEPLLGVEAENAKHFVPFHRVSLIHLCNAFYVGFHSSMIARAQSDRRNGNKNSENIEFYLIELKVFSN